MLSKCRKIQNDILAITIGNKRLKKITWQLEILFYGSIIYSGFILIDKAIAKWWNLLDIKIEISNYFFLLPALILFVIIFCIDNHVFTKVSLLTFESKHRNLDTVIISLIIGYLIYFFTFKMQYIAQGFFANEWCFFIGMLLILCYFLWVSIRIFCKEKEEDKFIFVESDKPLEDFTKDSLKRLDFINGLHTMLSKIRFKDSLVIGLYGKWGCGKSSVLNILKKQVDKENHFLIMEFNPWYFKDDEALINSFLSKLMKVVIEDKASLTDIGIRSKMKRYINKLGAIQYKADAVTVSLTELTKIFLNNSDTIVSMKKDIDEILSNNNRRIIVFIDDIDRLNKSQMESIFSLVKLIANFPNVCYILAFDEEIVNTFGFNKEFLDKIIQMPIHLPRMNNDVVTRELLEKIQDILFKYNVVIEQQDMLRWSEFEKYLYGYKLTFRNSNRFINTLIFSIPILEKETNIVDLIVIEFLRVFFPDCYKSVYANNYYFLYNRKEKIFDNSYAEQMKNAYKEEIGSETYTKVEPIINSLFPGNIFQSKLVNLEQISNWGKERRICSSLYFNKYFQYGGPEISESEINNFVQEFQISNINYDSLNIRFNDIIKNNSIRTFLAKLMLKKELLVYAHMTNLTEFILFVQIKDAKDVHKIFFQMKSFFEELLCYLTVDDSFLYSDAIVRKTESLLFVLEYMKLIRSEIKHQNGESLFNEEKIIELYQSFVKRIEKIEIFKDNRKNFKELIVIWAKYGDKTELSEYILKNLSEPSFLEEVVLGFFPYGVDKIDQQIWSDKVMEQIKKNYCAVYDMYDITGIEKNYALQIIFHLIKSYDQNQLSKMATSVNSVDDEYINLKI